MINDISKINLLKLRNRNLATLKYHLMINLKNRQPNITITDQLSILVDNMSLYKKSELKCTNILNIQDLLSQHIFSDKEFYDYTTDDVQLAYLYSKTIFDHINRNPHLRAIEDNDYVIDWCKYMIRKYEYDRGSFILNI